MKISLKATIYAGNTVMLILTLFVCISTIINVEILKDDFDNIIPGNMSQAELIEKLIDTVHQQDIHEKDFLLYKNMKSEKLFKKKSDEFKALLKQITSQDNGMDNKLTTISYLHSEYTAAFAEIINADKDIHKNDIQTLSRRTKDLVTTLRIFLKEMNDQLINQRKQNINELYTLLDRVILITVLVALASSIFAISFAFLFSQYIVHLLSKVKDVTVSIKTGNFDEFPTIEGSNEFADLNVSFKEMALRLKELEAMRLDANPLTKIPGNYAIEKELILRFKNGRNFSFCLLDIDNFKAYSDKYGYSQGSDVLLWLGNLIRDIVKEYGEPDDFVGHIGGDDFVIISETHRITDLSQKIITLFDKNIISFYSEKDQANGYIISVDRKNNITQFPFMTISIAIVSNEKSSLTHPKEVAEKIADLKQYAKTFPRSIYVCDNRRVQ